MKRTLALVVLFSAIGCASHSQYHPVTRAMLPTGYGETSITTDRVEVYYLGAPENTLQDALDFALYRAAEVALERELPYLVIEDRRSEMKTIPVGGLSVQRPEVYLTVRLYQNRPDSDGEALQAQEVVERLRDWITPLEL